MEQKVSKTFKEVCDDWYKEFIEQSQTKGAIPSPHMVYLFAEWLDKFQFLHPQLQVAALMKTRAIDREFSQMLIDELIKFDPEAPKRIAKTITMKHRHTDIKPGEESSSN